MSVIWSGITEEGAVVPVQVTAEGKVVAVGDGPVGDFLPITGGQITGDLKVDGDTELVTLKTSGNIDAGAQVIGGNYPTSGYQLDPFGALNLSSSTSNLRLCLTVTRQGTQTAIIANSGAATFKDVSTYNPTISSSGDLYRGYSDFNGTNSLQFSVTSAGLVQARTGTINVIGSERRIKEEINPVDAAISWETIKNTPYYSYKFIGSDFLSYGPIVDEVPSEMVMEGMTSDETGNIRTYDNGMLQARLYTALQAALIRIEALELIVTPLNDNAS